MKLRQFEFLCLLKEYGSISRAAEEAYTSQPTISIAIKELEMELGYALLRRTNRGIQFTERGEKVLEQAQIILQAIDHINHISVCSKGELLGTLHAGGLPHICNTLLLNVRTELEDQYPEFTLQLHEAETGDLLKMLERGSLDLAVVQECDVLDERFRQKIESGQLYFELLTEEELSVAVPEGHPLLSRDRTTLDDLRPYPFAMFGDDTNRCISALMRDFGYPEMIHHFPEKVRMRRFMQLQNGITIMPYRAIAFGNRTYQIKFVPLKVEGHKWITQVGWVHRGKELTGAEQQVVERLRFQCSSAELLEWD